MSFRLGGLLDSLGGYHQTPPHAATPPLTNTPVPEKYAGGTLTVAVKPGDTQQTFVHRALMAHAKAAGLSDADAREFADKWTNKNTTFNHRASGQSAPYTAKEFQALKAKGETAFDLTQEFDADMLADLNERVGYNEQFKVVSTAYTPEERAAMMQQQKGASVNQAAIQNKPVLEMINARTRDGQPLTEDAALARYVARTYNKDGRVWGDKINELIGLAKANGVKVENLQVSEDKGTATFNLSAADKQKLDCLFAQAHGETVLGEQAGLKGHSAAKLSKLEYQSEYGQKNGHAGEIGTEIGVGLVSAPSLLRTAAGKVIFGGSGTYNMAAGAAGVDPTEKDADGNAREMSTLERGLRIVGGAAEVLGARPTFDTTGKTGTVLSQTDEVIEALTPDGQTVRVAMPKQSQTADKLNSKIVTVDSNGNPSGTRFRSDYEDHIKFKEVKASQKNGISGCHNLLEFLKETNGINVVKVTKHPNINGVYKYEYQMPKLDNTGNPIPGQWRARTFEKTVYDPRRIDEKQILQMGREAFADAIQNSNVNLKRGDWSGQTSNGTKFFGHIDRESGAVRTFYFDF